MVVMLLLGVDFESTGLNVNEDRIIEIGAVIWDTTRQAPVRVFNEIINVDCQLKAEITAITGINQGDLNNFGVSLLESLNILVGMTEECAYIVGHNCNGFDKPLLLAECEREHVAFPDKHWLDTSLDIPYPEAMKTRKLVHLAAEHGFVNPFAHRAFADVLTMFRVLSHYDIDAIIDTSKQPTIKLLAIVKKPWEDTAPEGKKETDLARARGYRWEGVTKRWIKLAKKKQVESELQHGEFQVREIEL